MNNYPPGFSDTNDHGTMVFSGADENSPDQEEELVEESVEHHEQLKKYLPKNTIQCNRLKDMAMDQYSGRESCFSYVFPKSLIHKFLDPFTIPDFLEQDEHGRKRILDLYFLAEKQKKRKRT